MTNKKDAIHEEQDNEAMRCHGVEFFLQQNPDIGVLVKPHIHSSVELIFIAKGEYSAQVEHRFLSLSQGDILLVRPGIIHSVQRSDAEGMGEYYVLKVSSSFMHSTLTSYDTGLPFLCYAVSRPDDVCLFRAGSEGERSVSEHIKEMIREYESDRADSMIAIRIHACTLLFKLARLICSDGTATDMPKLARSTVERIHESLQIINERYGEPISPVDCAAEVCMSYSSYAHAFRAVMGRSFKSYLTEVRLRRAEEKILNEDCTVTEVALSCGYENVSYFIKEYKRKTGYTPHAHRLK